MAIDSESISKLILVFSFPYIPLILGDARTSAVIANTDSYLFREKRITEFEYTLAYRHLRADLYLEIYYRLV